MVNLNYKKLKPFLLAYVSAPVFVFLVGYLRWYWAIPAGCALAYAFCRGLRSDGAERSAFGDFSISKRELVIWFAFALLFTHLCGLSGFWYQTTDWNARNPIYKDIITRPWPVFYESRNTALCYYIGYWLVPAVPAKIVYTLFGMNAGWLAGHFTLWLWSAAGLFLILLSAFVLLKADRKKSRIATAAAILLFSGLDILGVVLRGEKWLLGENILHLEWWYLKYQFSSITTCLCWVFNQTVIPWICVMIFLMEKDSRNYLLIGTACFHSGPFPFVGLVILMVVRFLADCVCELRRKKTVTSCLCTAFSPQNLAVLCLVFPLVALYLLSNNATSAGVLTDTPGAEPTFWGMVCFFVLEAGVYWAILWREHRRDVLFYAAVGTLLLCPFIRIGEGYDFCMRVSVPGVLLMAIWCAKRVCALAENGLPASAAKRLSAAALLVVLTIGAATPGMELYRGFYRVITNKTIFLENTEYDSIEDYSVITVNFEASDPNHLGFYQYFAKKLVGGRGKTARP